MNVSVMNASVSTDAHGPLAALRRWASTLAELVRPPPPAAGATHLAAAACARLALRAASGIRAGANYPERAELLVLALANLRAAVLVLTPAPAEQESDQAEPLDPELTRIVARATADDAALGPDDLQRDFELLFTHAERRLDLVEEPMRRARAARLRSWAVTLAPVCVVLLGLALGRWALFGERELSAGKPWTTSSATLKCDPVHKLCGGVNTSILFHTDEDASPWAEIDLGKVEELTRIEVKNRSDCCAERALPLIVEVSVDHQAYQRVARKFAVFDRWSQRFPATRGRYVRFRVDRPSLLHLEQMRVFGHHLD